jgi:zinc transport system substrate-binding protein
MYWRLKLFLGILIWPLAAQAAAADDRLTVFVSILPQKYFVQEIGRQRVDVRVMVQPGASPATYEPKSQQMAALYRTIIYFAVGVPFENAWLPKIAAANPGMQVIHTDRHIRKIAMAARHPQEAAKRIKEGRQSDPAGVPQSRLDPHTWLSPLLVKIQARTIVTALQEVDPAHRVEYAANYNAFAAKVDRLDAELRAVFAEHRGLQFMVFHPAWGYFAETYGLEQVPIELEGKSPKPAQLQALIERARAKDIKVIFVQPQFSTRSAELVAREIGGQVVFADPLAEDWLTNLREVAVKFKAALK